MACYFSIAMIRHLEQGILSKKAYLRITVSEGYSITITMGSIKTGGQAW